MMKKQIAARKFARRYLITITILVIALISILYKTFLSKLDLKASFFVLVLWVPLILFSIGIVMWIFSPLTSRYKTWSQGAKGEELVAKYLENLEDNYFVMHDVMLPDKKGNIDHIVVGRNGIFVIETKTHKGVINCDGDFWTQEKTGRRGTCYEGNIGNPSKQVKGNTIALRKFFEKYYPKLSGVWINAILVFANKYSIIEATNPTVPILNPEQVEGFIKHYKSNVKISDKDIENLRELFQDFE